MSVADFKYRFTFQHKYNDEESSGHYKDYETIKKNTLKDFIRTKTDEYIEKMEHIYYLKDYDEHDHVTQMEKSFLRDFNFLPGFHQSHFRDQILEYLIRLRQGLEIREDIRLKIVYEKLNFMIILLTKEKNAKAKLIHDADCFCDYVMNGCRQKRLLKTSIARLKNLNSQLKKEIKNDQKVHPRLQKFQEKKEKYSDWLKGTTKEREKAKNSRQSELLEISKLYQIMQEQKKTEKVNAYREKIKILENEELERKKKHDKKLAEERERLRAKLLRNETLLKQKIVNKHLRESKEAEEINIPDISEYIPEEDKTEEDSRELQRVYSEADDLEEAIALPVVTIKNSNKDEPEQSSKYHTPSPPQVEVNTGKLNLPKLKRKKIKKVKKFQNGKKSLKKRNNNIEVQQLPKIVDNNEKPLKRTKRVKIVPPKAEETKKITTDNISKKLEKEEEEESELKQNFEKEKYLEVDLGSTHTVHQIVLETIAPNDKKDKYKSIKDKKSVKLSKSFTLCYSEDGEKWMNYNDAIANIKVFTDNSEDPFSIHILEEGLETRFLRVYPTSIKNNALRIRETLLGTKTKEETKEIAADDNRNQPRKVKKKHTKRIMDTPKQHIKMEAVTIKFQEQKPILPDLTVVSSQEEVSNRDYKNMVDDDLKVNLKDGLQDSLTTTTSMERNGTERKMSSTFSVKNPKDEIQRQKEERLRREVEEMKNKMEHEEMLAKRTKEIKNKLNKLKKDLYAKNNNNGDKTPKFKRIVDSLREERREENPIKEVNPFSQYCIYTEEQLNWYRAVFDVLKEYETDEKDGHLPLSLALDALFIINKSLVTDTDYEYIFLFLQTFGVKVFGNMDFKMFLLVAAFSERIKSFRKQFHIITSDIDYYRLTACLSKSKVMYEMLLRDSQKFIDVEDFIIETKAAKMSPDILNYVLKQEGRKKLDFFDYLTFFPLFLHTHDVIIQSSIGF